MPQELLRNMLQQILVPGQLLKDIPMLLKNAIYFHPPLKNIFLLMLFTFSEHIFLSFEFQVPHSILNP